MVTPSEVRDELAFGAEALGLADAEFDTLVGRLIERETERVADEIDVLLGTETTTARLSRPRHVDEYALPLPDRPVQSVVDVTIDTDRAGEPGVSASDYRIVDGVALELEADAGRRRWPTDRRSITVEWTHGYAEGEIPGPIQGAIVGLVRHALQEVESDGVENESIGDNSVSYELGDDVVARHLARAKQFDAPSYYGGAQVI